MPNLEPWIPIIAPVATVLTAAIAAIPLYRQTNLKRQEEVRLTRASRAEVDARLYGLFVQLMAKAHARGESTIAETAIQAAISSGGALAPTSIEAFSHLVQAAVVTYPVGLSEQLAAIAAVAQLGARYDSLHAPALAGLQSLASWFPPPLPPALTAAIERLSQPAAAST